MIDGLWSEVGSVAETGGRLCAALVGGAILGLDREVSGHAAGLRTHMLVALAAAASAILALDLYEALLAAHPNTNADPLRVIEGLVTAIGFLGGGVILLRGGTTIVGLTTAANLWVCGMIGLAFGAGLWTLAILTLVLAFVVLVILRFAVRSVSEKEQTPARDQVPGADHGRQP